uniref:Uncharacterized protein n=1 Tax=Rhizophora mucronata TaxID=61149 RepID=A0A2P2IGY4_RHIMU
MKGMQCNQHVVFEQPHTPPSTNIQVIIYKNIYKHRQSFIWLRYCFDFSQFYFLEKN